MESRYQPIENYGIIGNMRTAALVGMDGSIDWLCLPHFDSPSVFAAILDDRKGGRFRIAPAGDHFRRKQFYWPDTNVLITRFLHADGVGEVEDYMPVGGTGAVPDELIRRVRVVRGRVAVPARVPSGLRLRPRRPRHATSTSTASASTGRACRSGWPPRCRCGPTAPGWSPSSRSGKARTPRSSCARLAPDDEPGRCPGVGEAEELFRDTVAYWRRWLSQMHLHRPLARDGPALGADAQAAVLRADRGDRRGPDLQPARVDRRPAELGLPLHLDPRRRVHALWPAAHRLHRGGGPLQGLAEGPLATTPTATGPARCSSCTASTAGPISRRRRSTTWRATAARGRCGSATAPTGSCNWTSTAS